MGENELLPLLVPDETLPLEARTVAGRGQLELPLPLEVTIVVTDIDDELFAVLFCIIVDDELVEDRAVTGIIAELVIFTVVELVRIEIFPGEVTGIEDLGSCDVEPAIPCIGDTATLLDVVSVDETMDAWMLLLIGLEIVGLVTELLTCT